jgi:hypothetical protein
MGAPQPRQSIEEAIDRIYSIAFQAGEIPPHLTEENAKSLMRAADARKIKRALATAMKTKAYLDHQAENATRH